MVVEIKIFNRTNFYIVMKKVYHLLSVALLRNGTNLLRRGQDGE